MVRRQRLHAHVLYRHERVYARTRNDRTGTRWNVRERWGRRIGADRADPCAVQHAGDECAESERTNFVG